MSEKNGQGSKNRCKSFILDNEKSKLILMYHKFIISNNL